MQHSTTWPLNTHNTPPHIHPSRVRLAHLLLPQLGFPLLCRCAQLHPVTHTGSSRGSLCCTLQRRLCFTQPGSLVFCQLGVARVLVSVWRVH
jgi:hypothetical protein